MENETYSYFTPIFGSMWPSGIRVFETEKEEETKQILAKKILQDSSNILDVCSDALELYKKGYPEFTKKLLYSDNGDRKVPEVSFKVDPDFFFLLVDSIGVTIDSILDDDKQHLNDLYSLVNKLTSVHIFDISEDEISVSTFFRDDKYIEHTKVFEGIINDAAAIDGMHKAIEKIGTLNIDNNIDTYQTILMLHRLSIILGAMVEYVSYQWDVVTKDEEPGESFLTSELYKCLEPYFDYEDEGDDSDDDENDDSDDDENDDSSTENFSLSSYYSLEDSPPKKNPIDDDKTMKNRKNDKKQDEFNNDDASIDKKSLKLGQKAKLLLNTLNGKEGFFKKYVGRIDGLLEKYGDEAKVRENKMNGDPVDILMGPAKDYIIGLADGLNKIFQEFQNTLNGMSHGDDPAAQIKSANNYMKVDINKVKNFSEAFYNAFMKRVANVIMPKNIKIYGFTSESIVLNGKVPPPNHAIVSFFVSNAHEQLEDISVSQVFKGPESYNILANADKIGVMQFYNNIKSRISNSINKNFYNNFKDMKNQSLSLLKGHTSNSSFANEGTEKSSKRTIESIWKGADHATSKLLTFKSYILQCCDSYMNMVSRIDNLATKCMGALLEQEKMASDARYGRKGFGVASSAKIRQLSENPNYTPKEAATKTEKIAGSVGGMISNRSISKSARQSGVHSVVANTNNNEPLRPKADNTSPDEKNQQRQEWKEAVNNARKKLNNKKSAVRYR